MDNYKLIYFDKQLGEDIKEITFSTIEEVLSCIKNIVGNYERDINESVGFQIITLNKLGYGI